MILVLLREVFCLCLQVKIHAGPRLLSQLKFGPPPASAMNIEYCGLECAMELVDDVEDAISHIHKYGSAHTDSIITENGQYPSKVEIIGKC